jgi:DedD protein
MNQEQGASTGSLLGAFFAVVVLCAVCFSLGFFLGYRQGHPAGALTTEQVPPASDLPSAVNPPASAPSSRGTTGSEGGAPAQSNPAAASESQPAESDISPVRSSAAAPAGPGDQEASSSQTPEALDSSESVTAARVSPGLLVQVAAVTNQQDAANMVSVLKSKNYPALVLTPPQARAKDGFYRVVAGPYRTRTEAEKARKDLIAEGFKPFIR